MIKLKDELTKLNEIDYKLSSDFSSKVIDKAKKSGKYSWIEYVVCIGSVACSFIFTFVMANKVGLFNNMIISNEASSISSNYSEAEGQQLAYMPDSSSYDRKTNDDFDEAISEVSLDRDNADITAKNEVAKPSSVSKKDEIVNSEEAIYTVKMTKKDYLEQISRFLISHKYEARVEKDKVITKGDMVTIYKLLEDFDNIMISKNGDNLEIELNK